MDRKAPRASALAAGIGARIAPLAAGTVPSVRRLRREISGELRDAPGPVVIAAATRLSQANLVWGRFVAYEILRNHPGARRAIGRRDLARLGRGMASWEAVDCFATYVSGPAWRDGRVPDGLIHAWAASPDRWWRRAAAVSTVPLNVRAQGGVGDSRRTLRVCRMLERDRDPMVVKAVSWALRALAPREPAAVRAFVSARSGALAALVLREVRNKLDTGLKNPRGRRPAR